jgi:large subunit ribosomal protein L21
MGIYAVIKTGGKQYRVSPGDILKVEKLAVLQGGAFEISDVFLFVNDGEVAVGNPTVANVRIIAEVVEEGRGEKIRIFKQRRRKHYKKMMGHRQYYSAIRINEIIQGDKSYKADGADAHTVGVRGDEDKRPAAPASAAAPIAKNGGAPLPSQSPDVSDAARERQAAAPPRAAAPVTPPSASRPAPVANATAKATEPRIEANTPTPIVADSATRPASSANDGADVERNASETRSEARPAVPSGVAQPMPSASLTSSGPLPMAPIASVGPKADSSSRKELYWSLLALLGLLVGGAGWLLEGDEELVKGDEEPAIERAHIDVEPVPAAQPPQQPAVQEITVRKPARASSPSAPAQPPD